MLDIHDIYSVIFRYWRSKHFKCFLEIVRPTDAEIILDVGGYPKFWTVHPQPVSRFDVLNVHTIRWDADSYPEHRIMGLVDETDKRTCLRDGRRHKATHEERDATSLLREILS